MLAWRDRYRMLFLRSQIHIRGVNYSCELLSMQYMHFQFFLSPVFIIVWSAVFGIALIWVHLYMMGPIHLLAHWLRHKWTGWLLLWILLRRFIANLWLVELAVLIGNTNLCRSLALILLILSLYHHSIWGLWRGLVILNPQRTFILHEDWWCFLITLKRRRLNLIMQILLRFIIIRINVDHLTITIGIKEIILARLLLEYFWLVVTVAAVKLSVIHRGTLQNATTIRIGWYCGGLQRVVLRSYSLLQLL